MNLVFFSLSKQTYHVYKNSKQPSQKMYVWSFFCISGNLEANKIEYK